MATHLETRDIEGPFPHGDPFERARHFYEANGYVVESEQERLDDTDAATPGEVERLVLQRGEKGAGWWSSNMTDLLARVDVRRTQDGGVGVVCRVDITGQIMKEPDEAFWRREVDAAAAYIVGEVEDPQAPPRDLREEESARAAETFRGTLRTGLRGSILAFLVLCALLLVLYRIGLITF